MGGGSWPPMELLKDCWMREIDEVAGKSPPAEYDDVVVEDQIADADMNNSSDDESEHQVASRQAPDSVSTATSFDDTAGWGNDFVDVSAAASAATADLCSFDFSAATSSAQSSFDVTSTFDEQYVGMFDTDLNTVSLVDMNVIFALEDNFMQQSPVFQGMTAAWPQ
jgi:hypothetical protein